ncbi:MAG: M48 family metalloprotease [Pirellulaceae bacterium]|nr:M48 family metalloprotease [Pirellulaceae bacterium]
MSVDSNDLLAQAPARQQLLDRLERANRISRVVVLLMGMGTIGLAALVDWQHAAGDPWLAIVCLGVVAGPLTMELLRIVFRKKKLIEDLMEQTRFGIYDKHRLRRLYDDTLRLLQLPNQRVPLFITADKSLNAMVVHPGLGWLSRSFHGIYLHRQMLHKLNPREVQDTLGHELGHYYRYYLTLDRYLWLALVFSALLGMYVSQSLFADGMFGPFPLLITNGSCWYICNLQRVRHSKSIEFLCDDMGAHTHGVVNSISALMKLGVESELELSIHIQASQAARSGKLQAMQIVQAIEAAIPYGHASHEQLMAAVERELQNRALAGPSVAGFLRYAWQSDADAEADEEYAATIKRYELARQKPRILWESLVDDPTTPELDDHSAEALIQLMAAQPSAELFPVADAMNSEHGSHPSLKQRILYLWKNRREIENSV